MSYVSLGEFKMYLRNEIPSADDTDLQQALDVADQMINDKCGRSFTVAGTAAARTFVPSPVGRDVLLIHDATTITSVVENGVTLTSGTDYLVEPVQTIQPSGEVWPYRRIRRQGASAWYSYNGTGTVVVTGTWGWSAVPARVKMSAKVLAKDIIGHRDVKFGLVGVSDFGGIRARLPNIVEDWLGPYVLANTDDDGAFAIDTLSTLSGVIHADVCSLNFGARYCSCGAVLTGLLPLYEV